MIRPVQELDRRQAVPALIGADRDFLIVSGLGGPTKDIAAITADGDHVFSMAGAMGAACSIGLGLALARPQRRVLVVTGDGELLMNLGALATIAMVAPPNLALVCVDNGRYGETGNQESHTLRIVDLEQVARGCGLTAVLSVNSEAEVEAGSDLIRNREGPVFVLLRVSGSEPPAGKRDFNASAARLRFKTALEDGR